MTITIQQLNHGFSSSEGITARVKESTIGAGAKLLRALLAVVSGCLSEGWYKALEESTAIEFRTLADNLINAPIQEEEVRFIELDSSIGKIRIEETGDENNPLKGMLTYTKGQFQVEGENFHISKEIKTLEMLQEVLDKNLKKEMELLGVSPYTEYEAPGELPEPLPIRNDLIWVNGNVPRLFPGQFFYKDTVTVLSLSDAPVVAKHIAEAIPEEKYGHSQIEIQSSFGKIRIIEKTRTVKEEDQERKENYLLVIKEHRKKGVRDTVNPTLDLAEIKEFSTIDALQSGLRDKYAEVFKDLENEPKPKYKAVMISGRADLLDSTRDHKVEVPRQLISNIPTSEIASDTLTTTTTSTTSLSTNLTTIPTSTITPVATENKQAGSSLLALSEDVKERLALAMQKKDPDRMLAVVNICTSKEAEEFFRSTGSHLEGYDDVLNVIVAAAHKDHPTAKQFLKEIAYNHPAKQLSMGRQLKDQAIYEGLKKFAVENKLEIDLDKL